MCRAKIFLSKKKKYSLFWCYKFISGCDDPHQILHGKKNYLILFILLLARMGFEKNLIF